MDIEYIKGVIYHQKRIQPGDYLSAEVISILRDGNDNDRNACFAQTKMDYSKDACLFTCEITCSDCGKVLIENLSKTALLNYLKDNSSRTHKPILCEDCKNARQAELESKKVKDEKEREQWHKLRSEERTKNALNYISLYLDPDIQFDKSIDMRERRKMILDDINVNYNVVTSYIKKMPYKDFLQTPYWKTISAYKKYKSGCKCAICGNNKNLATHHSTYQRHGHEHEWDVIQQDLIVLCKDCHSKFHDNIDDEHLKHLDK